MQSTVFIASTRLFVSRLHTLPAKIWPDEMVGMLIYWLLECEFSQKKTYINGDRQTDRSRKKEIEKKKRKLIIAREQRSGTS